MSNLVTPPQAPEAAQIRLLQVTARYPPYMGGIETHTKEVTHRLAKAGFDVTVLTTDLTGKLPAEENSDGVRVVRVRAWPSDGDFYWSPEVYKFIRSGKWDIIHCQGYHTFVPFFAMIGAWQSGIPYVLTFHSGGHSSGWRNAIRGAQALAITPLVARAKRLIGVSKFEADLFQKRTHLPANRFMVIPNGAHLPKAVAGAAPDPDHKLILSIGRLEHYKGHHRMIAAFPYVLKQYPTAYLRIVGSGPYQAELQHMVEELHLEKQVEIGVIPPEDRQGMATLLSKASLVTLLSEYESQGIAVMEALALKAPVLVADATALHELAEKGLVQGISLDCNDQQLADCVIQQLQHPFVPDHATLPSWDGCAAALATVYRGVLSGSTAQTRNIIL